MLVQIGAEWITIDQVVQLFNDFDPINETHVKKISDPRGGEYFTLKFSICI
jgi:hypothetical protein